MTLDLELARRLFFHMAVADFFRALRGECHMGAFTLSVCAIDAMAYLRSARPYNRRGGIRDNFKHWVQHWLVPLNNECVPDVLWAVRCGLVHTYGYSDAMAACGVNAIRYAHNEPAIHWTQRLPGFYALSLNPHIAEVTVAAFRFFDGLDAVCQAEPGFESELKGRLSLLNLISATRIRERPGEEPEVTTLIQAPPRYVDMDRALAAFDQAPPPAVATIRREIQRIYSER